MNRFFLAYSQRSKQVEKERGDYPTIASSSSLETLLKFKYL